MFEATKKMALAKTVPTIYLSLHYKHVRSNLEKPEGSDQLRFLGWIKKLHNY